MIAPGYSAWILSIDLFLFATIIIILRLYEPSAAISRTTTPIIIIHKQPLLLLEELELFEYDGVLGLYVGVYGLLEVELDV